jgi:hypothetical protein
LIVEQSVNEYANQSQLATEIGNEDEYSRQVSPAMQDLQNHYQVKLIVSNAEETTLNQANSNFTSHLPTNMIRTS